jgi:hypothetical protein
MKKHLKAELKYSAAEPLYESKFGDSLQCFTTFQPHADASMSLDKLVLPNKDGTPGFKMSIFEELTEPQVVVKVSELLVTVMYI